MYTQTYCWLLTSSTDS